MKCKILIQCISLILLSCRNEEAFLPDPYLKDGESLEYLVEQESRILIHYEEKQEEIVTKGSYSLSYKNSGYIVMTMVLEDFTVNEGGEVTTLSPERIFASTPLNRFLSGNTLSVNFYDLDDGLVDMDSINRFLLNSLKKGANSDLFGSSVFSGIDSGRNSLKNLALKKGERFEFSTSLGPKKGRQDLTMIIKDLDEESVTLRGRGTMTFPELPGVDHNLEGSVLISQVYERSTGFLEKAEFNTTSQGLLMEESLDEPVKMVIKDRFTLIRVQ